jgi:chromosome segregation ATPase
MMGSGLVHPVDMHHSGNPASSAQLLETLAGHLVEGQYDLREFLRQIARSKAYQRSVLAPDLNLWEGPPGGIATLCERSARFEAKVRGLAPELQRQQIELQEAAKKLANSQADVRKLQLQIDQAKELYGQRIQQRDQELAKQPLETQTPEQKEILQAAQERLDDQRNRIVALVNRRLALGEFVAQARGLQRTAQRRFQAILDEQSDCKQQQARIQALIEWLEARSRIENHESKVDPETNSQSLAQFELQSFELIESWRRAWALRTVRSLSLIHI